MIDENRTLGELLSDPRIRPIAADAIAKWDLSGTELWDKSLKQLRAERFGGEIARGLDRLFAAADSGAWYYPLYDEAECAEDETRRGASLVWFPAEDPAAGERPYILLAPGGGFVNVWNLTEGWPVAAQFNHLGYSVFILTYRVTGEENLLKREMEDFARAIRLIRARAGGFSVRWDRYITCGFSAGGYLTCLWNVPETGYAAFGLPKPRAVFPVYPLVSLKLCRREGAYDPNESGRLYGCDIETATDSPYEVPEHAGGFPPCALFLAAEDTLVDPEHSRLLARTLDGLGIPCRLEIGPSGGHGFADGTGMCMAGWTERAVRWYEGLAEHPAR